MIVAKVNIFATEAKTVYKMNLPEGLHGGEIRLKFRDHVWDGLIKLYVFNDHLETSTRVLPSGDVEIPAEELIENQHLRFGVYGIDAKGETIIPTIWADLGIVQSAADPGQDPGLDPDLPVWTQILQRIGDLTQLATLCKSSLVCAINEIKQTAEDAKNTAEEVRRQAASGQFDGFSPTAAVEDVTGGVKLTVTDRYGTTEQVIKDGKDATPQDISSKQNWATIKLPTFPEAASADTLHAWVNKSHKGPDRKWLVESSCPDWAALLASLGGAPDGASGNAFILLEIPYSEAGPEMLRVQYVLRNSQGVWDMTQYGTYSTAKPTWYSTGWVKEEPYGGGGEVAKTYVDDQDAATLEKAKTYADDKFDGIPAWAMTPDKPTYTAEDVGALPDSTIIPTKNSQLDNDEQYEKAMTVKASEKLPGVTSIETLRKFLYDRRKSTQRKAQFEISPGGVNAYLMDILGYPSGATADDKAFLYVELPYSEAGGYEIRYRYQLRDKPGIWNRTDYATLDTGWKTTGWIETAPGSEFIDTSSYVALLESAQYGQAKGTLTLPEDGYVVMMASNDGKDKVAVQCQLVVGNLILVSGNANAGSWDSQSYGPIKLKKGSILKYELYSASTKRIWLYRGDRSNV